MARQHRRGRKRVLYYACVYRFVSREPDEHQWDMIHWLPAKTPERAMRTATRLERRYPDPQYVVDAPAVRYIPGDTPS